MSYKFLLNNIQTRKVLIGIVGLGYVGLPLVKEFTNKKFKVIGFDVDKKKIQKLKNGKSYIKSISNFDVKNFIKNKFQSTNKFSNIKKCDIIIYCLPTPVDNNKSPDMRYIKDTLISCKKFFRKGQLHILESTTYPGTTEEFFIPVFDEKSLQIGRNVFLGYSPEREDPGNKKYSINQISKIVSGYSSKCKNLVFSLYNQIVLKSIRVSSIRTAEMTKLLENIYRCVNIGLMNELKVVCEKMSLDIFEIIDAAKTKPFGFQAFYPGPGLGGHCIPIDPYILSWKAKEYGVNTRFIELAGQINESMPEFVVKNLKNALDIKNKTLNKSKILILGVAYKKNVDDTRESPAFKIIEILKKNNVQVTYSDPHVKRLQKSRKYNLKYNSVKLNKKNLSNSDAVVLVTDHDEFDYKLIEKYSRLIIDTRGKFSSKMKKVYRS
jgi:UDP-N-acetyl-D-glucosamine dehydrogenase